MILPGIAASINSGTAQAVANVRSGWQGIYGSMQEITDLQHCNDIDFLGLVRLVLAVGVPPIPVFATL